MKIFEHLAAVLLDPSENASRFVAHCNALLGRVLDLPHLPHMTQSLKTHALALCVCSHLCGASIESVYRKQPTTSQQSQSEQGPNCSQEQLSYVWENVWKPAVRELGLDKVDSSDNRMISRELFDDYNILFVPSVLFSGTCASLLLKRVQEKGGNGRVCSPGERGFREAKELLKKGYPSYHKCFVCADVSLINKYSKLYALQTRPPKWLLDSLRDSRIKDATLYVQREDILPDTDSPEKVMPEKKRKNPELESNGEENFYNASPKRPRTSVSTTEEKAHTKSGYLNISKVDLGPCVSQVPNDNGEDTNSNLKQREVTSPVHLKSSSHVASPRTKKKSSWACELRTSFSGSDLPMNEKICELLGIVQESCLAKKDHFRATGYQRAIARIKSLEHEVTTVGDVRDLSSGKGIGERMGRKVREIVTTGRLLQAETVLENPENVAVKELCQVWGIGPVKALNLISHGIKTIAELRDAVKKDGGMLDRNQKIGLRHCEDLLLRIPRKHVAELECFVRMVVKSVDQSLEITVAGSYLRGKKDCGDVDIIVCGCQERLRFGFRKVIDVMRKKGVLTDDLIVGDVKYFGIFRFPGRPHGRVDLFAVPQEEYPFALLTYTGSAIFNRSMRAKARALGYSLSHTGIQKVSRGKHSKTRVEPPIRVRDEREIFFLLDIPYVAPPARSI